MLKIYDLEEISQENFDFLIKRSSADIDSIKDIVKSIINDVKLKGDFAIKNYTELFDEVRLTSFKVTEEVIEKARKNIDEKLLCQIKRQITYSKKFHKNQLRKEYQIEIEKGIILGERYTPIDSVGLYIPGGKAAYPTVLQILAVPAKIANVPRIVVCTPPNKEGKISDSILVIADILGIKEIYKIGGAQAIAALALGTKTIEPVKKVVGPGNIYVNCAKKQGQTRRNFKTLLLKKLFQILDSKQWDLNYLIKLNGKNRSSKYIRTPQFPMNGHQNLRTIVIKSN